MAITIKRQSKEPNQLLVKKFAFAVQRSGVLLRARERMFRKREKSEQMKKREALRREQMRQKYERLRKLGEL